MKKQNEDQADEDQILDVVDDYEEEAREEAPEMQGTEKYDGSDYLDDLDDLENEFDLVDEGELDPQIYVRTSTLFPMEKLMGDQVRVIGVGGIGRNVGLQLAAVGCGSVVLFDDDEITKTNVSTQGYPYLDVGAYKVSSLLYHMNEMNPGGIFLGYADTFPLGKAVEIEEMDRQEGPVFCCVDKIGERAKIFKALRNCRSKCPIFIDGRMAAETGRVITILCDEEQDTNYYETTLFKQEEQEPEKCTEKATIYCGDFIASLMLAQYTRWIRGLIKPGDRYRDVIFSLKTFDIFQYQQPVGDEKPKAKSVKAAASKKGGRVKRKTK